MAQVVALVLLAQAASSTGSGVTSLKVGEFLSMEACRVAASHSVTVSALPDAKVGFLCVPLSPVSGPK